MTGNVDRTRARLLLTDTEFKNSTYKEKLERRLKGVKHSYPPFTVKAKQKSEAASLIDIR